MLQPMPKSPAGLEWPSCRGGGGGGEEDGEGGGRRKEEEDEEEAAKSDGRNPAAP